MSTDFPARIRGHLDERVWTGTGGAARRDGVRRHAGDGANRLSAVHVDNAAEAHALALDRAEGGRVWNVAAETVRGRALAEAEAVAEGAGGLPVAPATVAERGAATHPFLALLLSLTFNLNAATARDLDSMARSPRLADDAARGSHARAA